MIEVVEVDSDVGTDCLFENMSNHTFGVSVKEPFCHAVWDSVYCWPPTPPGLKIKMLCSEIFNKSYAHYSDLLQGYAHRECLMNGTWKDGTETNYNECRKSFQTYVDRIGEDNVLVPVVHQMLFWGSILSVLFLGTSLLIFYKFRKVNGLTFQLSESALRFKRLVLFFDRDYIRSKNWSSGNTHIYKALYPLRCLQCDRITVHAQLMLSLLLRFSLMLIISEPFVIGHTESYRDVEILCESILVIFLYSTFSSISWMFVQGLYLNAALTKGLVTTASTHQLTVYYIIGWGVPAGFIGGYVISMSLRTQEKCWKGYSEMDEMWILLGPISLELMINGIFLLNIVRILLKKVRNSTTRPDSSQLKAATKATIILFPVLGINNLVLLYNPGGDYNKYFRILNTFFGATQGIFVSIVFCFADKDVCAAVLRSIKRANARRMRNSNRNPVTLPRPLTQSLEMVSHRDNVHCESNVMENSV